MPAIDFLPYNVKRRQLFVKPYGYVAVSGGHSPFDWTTTRAKQPARAVSTDPIRTYDTGSPYTANRARARAFATPAICPPGCTPQTCPGSCTSESSVIASGAGSGASQTGQHTPTTITPATLTSRFTGINPKTAFTQNPSSSSSSSAPPSTPATNQTVANLEKWVRANPTAVIAVVVVGITLAIIGPRF